jgi:hypothetical protein
LPTAIPAATCEFAFQMRIWPAPVVPSEELLAQALIALRRLSNLFRLSDESLLGCEGSIELRGIPFTKI